MIEKKQQTAKPVMRVVVLQFFIVSAFASLVAALSNGLNGWSAAYGGGIAVLGSCVYALSIAGKMPDAGVALRAHVRGEMLKIFVTAVLYVGALVLFHSANWMWLIAGFAVATLAYWFSLLTV